MLGFWAYARRKLYEALKEDKTGAEYVPGQIGLLYRVEAMASIRIWIIRGRLL